MNIAISAYMVIENTELIGVNNEKRAWAREEDKEEGVQKNQKVDEEEKHQLNGKEEEECNPMENMNYEAFAVALGQRCRSVGWVDCEVNGW
ncbi:hypothetical protein SESBI_41753 [Sesbania bispinosa]|nr:hypothetical protein SESBI_41753 [Sesbania bispinosa]